jgi:hypothetical protein
MPPADAACASAITPADAVRARVRQRRQSAGSQQMAAWMMTPFLSPYFLHIAAAFAIFIFELISHAAAAAFDDFRRFLSRFIDASFCHYAFLH